MRSRLRLARQRLAHCLAQQGLGPPVPLRPAGPQGAIYDRLPAAPAVEVICLTLLINRPLRRE